MMTEEELTGKITGLETQKAALIEKIKKLNGRIRYKKYEEKALEPFLEKTKDIRIAPLRKQKRALEFRISTSAYTPKMEKELIKQVKKVDKELEAVREVERARRKKMLVAQDIEDANKEIVVIETELHTIREELKKLYGEAKTYKTASKKGIKYGGFESDMLTLEEMGVVIEDNTKKEEKE
jgi:uncharacterized coiled-coil DUF342 family protein